LLALSARVLLLASDRGGGDCPMNGELACHDGRYRSIARAMVLLAATAALFGCGDSESVSGAVPATSTLGSRFPSSTAPPTVAVPHGRTAFAFAVATQPISEPDIERCVAVIAEANPIRQMSVAATVHRDGFVFFGRTPPADKEVTELAEVTGSCDLGLRFFLVAER
jgi:hypothetical protein